VTEQQPRWQFWIDRGGTFTDIVAKTPEGKLLTHKLLSENPELYTDAAVAGIKILLGLQNTDAIPANTIEVIKMGTTVGTNALLERKGVPTVLVINRGLGDCLRIGYQNRPEIFALNIRRPALLYRSVVEVCGRYSALGEETQAIDLDSARLELIKVFDTGIRSVAIVLLHAWINPKHEKQLAKLAENIGFTQVSVSHRISPLMKIVSRGDTTVMDAYLSPLLQRYIQQVSSGLGLQHSNDRNQPPLMFMQSNGGLVDSRRFQGKDSLLSGPAGGIVGAVAITKLAEFEKIITFDMGGTSTDVAHYAGEYERSFDTEIAGVRVRAPMMRIHTVAAGGGSILSFDGMRYRVGPESAGANPGPAAYRRGGPLCVTDANIILGKLPVKYFPKVFGTRGDQPLDIEVVREKFVALSKEINLKTVTQASIEQTAEGYLSIATESMANAIKQISVQRGYDVSQYTLCCFGAAGGQHACKVADSLGIKKILIHPYAGILSAYGMGLADFRVLREHSVESILDINSWKQLEDVFAKLESVGRNEILAQKVSEKNIRVVYKVHIRYQGTDTALIVDYASMDRSVAAFKALHVSLYGFHDENKKLIIEAASVEVIGSLDRADQTISERKPQETPVPLQITQFYSGNKFHAAPIYRREQLPPGAQITGSAIVIEANSTTVIEPGWMAQISTRDDMILNRVIELEQQESTEETVDPVLLEIFNRRFMSIAEQMGHVLQNTAHSVNIKERLDFSCALFDSYGELIANAPHIPVHIGSMDESVKALIVSQSEHFQPGDVYLINSPFHGGTHLPDITVITPVFDHVLEEILFYVASRGHHADVGGITPGSMPPASKSIIDEGVASSGLRIVKNGSFLEQDINEWLSSSSHPARNPRQNLADIRAQIAANEKGIGELDLLVEHYSHTTVNAYMQHIQNNAEEAVRSVLDISKGGKYSVTLDNGAQICVAIFIDYEKRCAKIDFTGSSTQTNDNFNAPSAVTKAAVLYVFRTLIEDDIPLNAGCLRPLEIIVPPKSILDPGPPCAVVAGNVETSQCIVDACYGALGILAGSQGTMNNLTFGNDTYQYYETICGGAGAGKDFSGRDAVQTHMTNSRITDPEVLESRFPVILEDFSIRPNSGGKGQYRGGNGVSRTLKFQQAMTAAILSGHRTIPPQGLKDGQAGACGRNSVNKITGETVELKGCDQIEMNCGDSLTIETPGGGGYGKK